MLPDQGYLEKEPAWQALLALIPDEGVRATCAEKFKARLGDALRRSHKGAALNSRCRP